jgi:hypothetical protein
MMGIEEPWKEYRAKNLPADYDGMTPAEKSEANNKIYHEYEAGVEKRRLQSGAQANYYKAAKDFIHEALRNEEPMERIFGTLKGVAGLKYLSGLAAGAVNLTTLGTSLPAVLHQRGKIPFLRSLDLVRQYVPRYCKWLIEQKTGKRSAGLTDSDRKLFREINREGWDEALMNTEAMGVLTQGSGGKFRKVMDVAMLAFSLTERTNRAVSIAAAYRGLEEQEKGPIPEERRTQMLRDSKMMSDLANQSYGKESLPSWMQGGTIGAEALRMMYMYKTYQHGMLHMMAEMGFSKEKHDREALAYYLASMAVLAGPAVYAGMPGVAMVSSIVKAILSGLGMEPPDDALQAFYDWADETFGSVGGRFAHGGIAGMAGIDMSASLSVGQADLPFSLGEVLADPVGAEQRIFTYLGQNLTGPMAGLVLSPFEATVDVVHGRYLQAGEKMLGRAVAGPLKAYREVTEGVETRRGAPVFWGKDRMHASFMDASLRSLGFNPIEISAKRGKQFSETQIKTEYGDRRKTIYQHIDQWVDKDRTPSGWVDILSEVERYNAGVQAQGHAFVPQITGQMLKTQVTQRVKAPKSERVRGETPVLKNQKLPRYNEAVEWTR